MSQKTAGGAKDRIGPETLERLALLSRINLADREKAGLRKDLNLILDMVDELEKLDVSSFEALSHPLADLPGEEAARARKDQARDWLREEVLGHSANLEKNFYKVPKVLPSAAGPDK